MRVLIALGGNAMTDAQGNATAQAQQEALRVAAASIADVAAAGHEVILTHGNGPQVGDLLVQQEVAAEQISPLPLDWCGAMTQGEIGYALLNALNQEFAARGLSQSAAALVTRTRVSISDPAFANPTKPVGGYATAAEAAVQIAAGQQWEDRGAQGWRRVVPSPEPLEILDAPAALALVQAGFLVAASGGGGIPVLVDADGTVTGVEAVIDKDLSASVFAQLVEADVLVIATDVSHAILEYGTPQARPVERVTTVQMRELVAEGHFASGSMGPKVEAALRFAESGGQSVITSLDKILAAVAGDFGTVVQDNK